tara:strand:- start:94 stop:1209 length:1116 start_codon:yes stop_codon:yes gene_type:complete
LKKILIIGPKSIEGGMSRYVVDLLSKNSGNDKFEMVLFDTSHAIKNTFKNIKTSYNSIFNSGIKRAIQGLFLSIRNITKYPFFLKRTNPDVIHICGVSFYPFWERTIYAFFSLLAGKKIFLHYLGSFDQFYYSSNKFGKYFIRLSLSMADKIGVLSQRTFLDMSHFIDKDHLEMIPSSVEVTNIPERSSRRSNDLKLLFVGGSDPFRKGAKEILEVLPAVAKKHSSIKFIFSGSEILKNLISTLEISLQQKNTKFIGFFDEKDKWNIYQSADILLLPSHNEGLPYVIIEALASGLPIISSTVGGISEVVEDGKNGFIIEPGDKSALKSKILELANSPDTRLLFSKANWKKAREQYSLEENIERINNIYTAL